MGKNQEPEPLEKCQEPKPEPLKNWLAPQPCYIQYKLFPCREQLMLYRQNYRQTDRQSQLKKNWVKYNEKSKEDFLYRYSWDSFKGRNRVL